MVSEHIRGVVGHRPQQSWTRRELGCDVRFQGVTRDSVQKAKRVAEKLVQDVKAAVPGASAIMQWEPPADGVYTLWIHIVVTADDLACIHMGPTHLKAIGQVRVAAKSDRCWWEQ